MAEEGKEQDMKTKEISTLIINLRFLALIVSQEIEKLIRRTREAQAERKRLSEEVKTECCWASKTVVGKLWPASFVEDMR